MLVTPSSLSSHIDYDLPGIRSAFCKQGNVVSSKLGAQIVLRGIMGLPIDIDAIPDPEVLAELPETIVEAGTVRALDGVQVEYYI